MGYTSCVATLTRSDGRHLTMTGMTKLKSCRNRMEGCRWCNAVAVSPLEVASMIRHQQPRVISSRLVVRWKETCSGHIAKARWCVHGFKDPDIDEIEYSCPTPEVASTNIMMRILASARSEGTVADGEKAFMQGDPSGWRESLCAELPPEDLPNEF